MLTQLTAAIHYSVRLFCLMTIFTAVPSHAAERSFNNDYEIAVFCGATALSALPASEGDERVDANEANAILSYVRHWFTLAITHGTAMGLTDAAIMDEVNQQNAALSEGYKVGEAPFYDLNVCDAPNRHSLWLSVPATSNSEKAHIPRSGPIRLDRLADDREIDIFRSLSGRLRADYAHIDVKRALIGDVRILALQHAVAEMATTGDRAETGALNLSLARAFRSREIGVAALNVGHAIDGYKVAAEQLDPAQIEWGLARQGTCFSYLMHVVGDRSDNLEFAIAACQEALPALDRPETRAQWANAQLVLAGALSDRVRGSRALNLENAITADRAALSVRSRESAPSDWAVAQSNLGVHLSIRLIGDPQENIEAAIEAFNAAATIITREDSPSAWAVLQNNLAPLIMKRERGGKEVNQAHSIEMLQALLAMPEVTGSLRSAVNYNLGENYRHRIAGAQHDNLEQAVRYYRQAVLGNPLGQRWPITAGHALGNALIALGRYEEALDALLIASRATESLIGPGINEAQLRDVISDAGDIYVLSAFAASKLNDNRRALMLLSEGKARMLFTELAADDLDLSLSEMSEIRKLRAELQKQEAALEHLVRSDISGLSTDTELLEELNSIRQRVLILYDKGTRSQLAQPSPEEVVLQGSLIAPIVSQFGTIILVATQGRAIMAHEIPELDRDQMNLMTNSEAGGSLTWRGTRDTEIIDIAIDNALQKIQPLMGATIGAGIRSALDSAGVAKGSSVYVMPDGAYALLPISLARDDVTGHTLLEDYEISFIPNLAALDASLRRIASSKKASLAVLTPPTDTDIIYASIEGGLVEARFDATSRVGWSDTNKVELLQNLGSMTYWHFATHGTFDWDDPRQSGVFTGGSNDKLTLADLLESRKRIGAPRLVVLSACDTGLSDIGHNPDEFTGLPTGFLFAGAAGVVASLWQVNDISTTLLMSKFYELHRNEHQRPAQALRAAQIWLKNATLSDLLTYVEVNHAAGNISSDQASIMAEDLPSAGPSEELLAKPFLGPRYWGAFVLYGV